MSNPIMVGGVLHSFSHTGNAAVLIHRPGECAHITFSEHMVWLPIFVAELRDSLLKEYMRIAGGSDWALLGPLLTVEITFEKFGLPEKAVKRLAELARRRSMLQLPAPKKELPQPLTMVRVVAEVITSAGMKAPFKLVE